MFANVTEATSLSQSTCRCVVSYIARVIAVVAMVAYTANLAAILTAIYMSPAGRLDSPRHVTLRDVINNGGDVMLRYMTVRNSDVIEALKQTTEPSHLRHVWRQAMTSQAECLVAGVDVGLSGVETDSLANKAFVWHRPGLQYHINSRTADCQSTSTSLRLLDFDDHYNITTLTTQTRLQYSVVMRPSLNRRNTNVHNNVRPIDYINTALLQLTQQNLFRRLDDRSVERHTHCTPT